MIQFLIGIARIDLFPPNQRPGLPPGKAKNPFLVERGGQGRIKQNDSAQEWGSLGTAEIYL
jgi:hypothetical protein